MQIYIIELKQAYNLWRKGDVTGVNAKDYQAMKKARVKFKVLKKTSTEKLEKQRQEQAKKARIDQIKDRIAMMQTEIEKLEGELTTLEGKKTKDVDNKNKNK